MLELPMKGNWMKWVSCRTNAFAGFNPRDWDWNQLPCLVYPIRISLTIVGEIVHVSVTCVFQPSTSPLPQFSGQLNNPLSTPGLSFWLIENIMRCFELRS